MTAGVKLDWHVVATNLSDRLMEVEPELADLTLEIARIRGERDRLRLAMTREYNAPFAGRIEWASSDIEDHAGLKPGDMTSD